MKNDILLSTLTKSQITFKTNFDLTNKSTMKIHSTAKLFIIPKTFDQLQQAIQICSENKTKFFILGGGSNIIFPDITYDGAIISTDQLNNIQIINNNPLLITCSCGTPMSALVNFCTQHSISGIEEFAGLPGTIGGALYMNARCFEKSICENLYQTKHLDISDGHFNLVTQNFDSTLWDYKKSPFQSKQLENPQKILLSGTFCLSQLPPENITLIQQKCKYYINERISKGHFKYPSAGSVFKNNHDFGKPSGKLIDEAGLKGLEYGGAQIASFHANFIINKNNATSQDIKTLVKKIQNEVKNKFGFNLEPEILFLE